MTVPSPITTGTTLFNLDLNDLVEEAFERCGRELRTGYDFRTARRSLNSLTIEWANRGINLWTIEQGSIPLVQGTIKYDLPVDTIDLLEFVLDGQEYMIECYTLLEEAAEEEEHDDIANFAQDRLRKHKKNAWMIRASLES